MTNDLPEAQLETLKQAIAELLHCVDAGPQWFTKGEWGQQDHAREWARRGMAAIAELQKHFTPPGAD